MAPRGVILLLPFFSCSSLMAFDALTAVIGSVGLIVSKHKSYNTIQQNPKPLYEQKSSSVIQLSLLWPSL
jgi:hypothetical protein